MAAIVDLLYLMTITAISPVVLYRMIRHKRYRTGWSDRFGKIIRKHPEKKCIWIHAVSVGEVNATKTIIRELQNRFANFEIVLSTTTDTGFARANALFGKNLKVFYFPFDLSWTMSRAFGRIRPEICLLMELEVWPNFVQISQRLGVPVVIVNGRISDRSFSRYKKIKPVVKNIFKKIALTLAQTDEYAHRFKEIGCPAEQVIVTGSLKYDTAQITDKVEGADTLAAELKLENNRLWVAGGTGNDEEKIIIETYLKLKQEEKFNDLRLAIVPRKPERFDEVAGLVEQMGLGLVRYSKIKEKTGKPATDRQTVILGDTMGDLRKFYSLASLIFVGRSLVPMGGSDMAEAAALGKCTIFGPYAFNFKQTVDALLEGNGSIMVEDQQGLLETIKRCLLEPDYARTIAKNGQKVIRENQGATAKSIDAIAKILNTAR